MRNSTIARNYAEALAAVAETHGDVGGYGVLLGAVAGAVSVEPALRAVLESPRVPKEAKKQLLERALRDRAPEAFVRFLKSVVQRGRQGLLSEIATEYEQLVDRHLDRVHAGVVTARPVDEELGAAITRALTHAVGKTVLPRFRSDRKVLGGVIVRVGDRVYDGSLRRKLMLLRYRMLHAPAGGSE